MKLFRFWIVCSALFAQDPFSVERLIEFYDATLVEQKVLYEFAISPTPPGVTLPSVPPQKIGWVPFSIVNASQNALITRNNTFVVAKGLDPATGLPCFISFDGNGVGTCVDASASTVSANYTYPLTHFPLLSSGTPYMYMPSVTSARLYVSLNYELILSVVKNIDNIYTIVDPSPTVSDLTINPSYNHLYDKVEFNIQPDQCVINPTLVDFFCIPLPITVSSFGGCDLQFGGMPPSQNREAVFSGYVSAVNSDVPNANSKAQWQNLILSSSGKNLRILSTNTAMSASPTIFDPSYLLNSTYGSNWLQDVWSNSGMAYFEMNPLWMDLSQVPGYGLYKGQVSAGSFIFTKQTGSLGSTVTVSLPTTSVPFFAGTGFVVSGDATAAPIIEKFLSAGLESGILPAPTSSSNPVNNHFYQSQSNIYYENSVYLMPTNNGTWFDLYSKVLHSFAVYPYNYYTYAYDDVLGADNTITSNNILLNPIQITITIGNMSGTTP